MKRLLLIFALLCAPCWATIALVGTTHSFHNDASVASIATPSYSQGAGHSLAIGLRLNAVASHGTISDTAGDTFTPSLTLTAEDGTQVETYCVANTIANAGNVVTYTYGVGSGFGAIIVHEYSGTNTASCPDTSASNVNTANPITSGSFTPSAAGNVAIAFGQSSHLSTVFTAGASYTIQAQESYLGSEDFIGTGTGSQTASITFDTGTHTAIGVMVLNAAAGGASGGASIVGTTTVKGSTVVK